MKKYLPKILLVMAVSGTFALAQASSPQSSSSPDQPTSPSSSSSARKAQSQIQEALTKQMPSSNVTVSATSDNQLQLSGSVSSESDKQRAEDIAKSAAPGQTIVNKIKVADSSSDTNPK